MAPSVSSSVLGNRVRSVVSLTVLLLGMLCATATASAQIVFTVTATAGATAAGYTQGNSYTFIYTSVNSFAQNGQSDFTSNYNSYLEDAPSGDQIWVSIGGTGLLGTYSRPTDTNSFLEINNVTTGITLVARADTSSIGVTALDGTQLGKVESQNYATWQPSFTFPASYVEPFNATTGYMASHTGTYSTLTSGAVILHQIGGAPFMTFTTTSLSISAVPEPSTYAALAGLAAFGFVVLRRRRVAAA